jgi:hypothetical protein
MKTHIKDVMYIITRRLFSFFASIAFMALLSCSSNENVDPDISDEEKESAKFESEDDYYFQDADEIALAAFSGEEISGGRLSTDARLTGAVVLHTGTVASGSLKIDFGAGTGDGRGNIRKGIILLTHVGGWNEPGAQWTIKFVGYSINGVVIEGTRIVTVIAATDLVVTHEIELVDGKITWPNGRVATRAGLYIRECHYDASHLLTRLIVYGDAQGTGRNGRGFSIKITEELVYDCTCAESGVFIAVKGKKLITHGNREITIDYGDGTCDNIVTLTNKAGFSVQYEVSK